jgi:hypothetical protein
MHQFIKGALIGCAVLWGASEARALPIVGGEVKIRYNEQIQTLTEDILGVDLTASGSGEFDPETFTFTFPVTGGNAVFGDLDKALVEARGGGIRNVVGDRLYEYGDFVFDTETGIVLSSLRTADPVVGTPLDIAVGPAFFLTPNPGKGLPFAIAITPSAARSFNNTFGIDAVKGGDLVGTADVDIEVVPVPAALPLLATAVGGLGFALHRRRRTAA